MMTPSQFDRRVSIEGRGQPLLLVHGAGGPRVFDYMLAELYEHFQVVVPSLPGYRPEDGRVDYTDDLYVDFLEQVRVRYDYDSWAIAGTSLGGRVVLNYALEHRERVTHLIPMDATGLHPFPPPYALPLARNLAPYVIYLAFARPEVWTRNLSAEVTELKGPAAAWAVSFAHDILEDPVVRWNVARMLPRVMNPRRDWLSRLPALDVPSLVLWGSDDPSTPVACAYRLASLLPNCKLTILDGFRHSGMLERPDYFTREIIDFVFRPARKAVPQ